MWYRAGIVELSDAAKGISFECEEARISGNAELARATKWQGQSQGTYQKQVRQKGLISDIYITMIALYMLFEQSCPYIYTKQLKNTYQK